jgi:dihydroorotase
MANNNYFIHNAKIVNEGKVIKGDVVVQDGFIKLVINNKHSIEDILLDESTEYIDANGLFLFPGIIDDQVHFREPGLTHKADISSESKAAVAGGVTTFMDMPNTNPPALTQEQLEEKYELAAQKSLANYSFYMGASNDNADEVIKTDPKTVCGVKIFMGSSTGNMLVNKQEVLEQLFACAPLLIAVHCEDEQTVKNNLYDYIQKFGEDIPVDRHAVIRSEEACFKSSQFAVNLAKKYNTRLHVLHLSTAKELELFDHKTPLERKKITAEVCAHHLWFNHLDYEKYGAQIKCNPSVKSEDDQNGLLIGLHANKIDVIGSDHAPHTMDEKNQKYMKSPSGVPLVQHTLQMMLEMYHQGKLTLEVIIEKMCHSPAKCFQIDRRGFIRQGYFADLVLVDLEKTHKVSKENIHYKCAWSPFEDYEFHSQIVATFVNGQRVFNQGEFDESVRGERLNFYRS